MDYVRLHAQLHAQAPAVTELSTDRHWTYASFDSFVDAVVGNLRSRDIKVGDRVACLAQNCAEIIALHLACARLGAIFVPLNWRLSVAEIKQLLEDCAPSVLFSDGLAQEHDLAAEDIGCLVEGDVAAPPASDTTMSPDLPSLMLYTSGTTGKPKGVLLSERNLAETAINFSLLGEVDSKSRFLCESPMFHIIGMITSIRPVFLVGGSLVLSDRFIPDRTYQRLADPDLGITHYFCVPQMALAIRSVEGFDPARLCGLTAIFTGGAPHPAPQIRAWLKDGIAIVDGYGMSEAGTVFGMPLDRNLIDAKAGCVGVPTPRVEARIVDAAGHPVPTGVPGELQLSGDNITVGYWQREEEFEKSRTADGWFCTGDIVVKDDDGYYRITDRKKDMFISGGENVYPAEVEAVLAAYPGVRELAVVGVPDDKWGEVGCLFYVPNSSDLRLEDVEAFLAGKLARYKVPKKIIKVDAIPRNGVGKILKHQLRAPAESA